MWGRCNTFTIQARKLYLAGSCTVAAQRKKIIIFLVAAAVASSGLVLCLAQSSGQNAISKNVESRADSPSVLRTNSIGRKDESSTVGYDLANNMTDSAGIGELSAKMTLAVLLVIVLGAAAIYMSKKVLPRITNLPGKEIRILETAYLGPRKAVHLVKIGNQRLLIGSTNESITTLADLTDGFVQGMNVLNEPRTDGMGDCAR